MPTTISAIYEHGVIQPKDRLALPESSQIQIQILPNEPNEFARSDPANRQSEAVTRTLEGLQQLLNSVEQEWGNDIIQQVFLVLLQSDLRTLWQISLPQHRLLCALVELAVAPLRSGMLTLAHIQAFRFIFNILQQPQITQEDINLCHDRLMDARLSATFELGKDVLESYLDEL